MYIAQGIESGKVYIEADSKADCSRKLLLKYPSRLKSKYRPTHGKGIERIYPEPLQIKRRR